MLLERAEQHGLADPSETRHEQGLLRPPPLEPGEQHVERFDLVVAPDQGGWSSACVGGVGVEAWIHQGILAFLPLLIQYR